MSKALFVDTDFQKTWLNQLESLRETIEQNAKDDQGVILPKQNIESLVNMGYTALSLPPRICRRVNL
ncbi:acyl-CoA dehydrogenase [Bacillus safensis FO-36b] [Bacillus safensis subsp. safensis]